MTASALPLDFMTVESSTRWLPRRPKPSAQSQGGCATSGLTTGHQPQSFGRHQNGVLALKKSRVIGRLKLLKNFHNRMVGLGRARFSVVGEPFIMNCILP